MNRKEFDRSLQERLNNYSSHYSDQVWKNLEAELDNERKPLGFPLFNKNILSMFFLIAGIAGIAALTYINTYHRNENIKTKTPTEIKTNPNSIQQPLKVSKPKDVVAAVNYKNINTYGGETALKGAGKFNTKGIIGNADKGQSKSLIENPEQIQIAKANNEIIATDYTYVESSQTISSQHIMSVKRSGKDSKSLNIVLYDPKRNCPTFNTNAPGYFLEAFGSPDYNVMDLKSKSVEFESYKNVRKNSESALLGYTLGFRGGIEFRNGFSIKSGISYSNLRQKFNYTIYGVDIPKDTIIILYHGPGGGTIIQVSDTIHYTVKGNRYISASNSIKSIEIPLIVGYELDFTRWTLQFNAGISLQIANIQSGTVIDPQYNVVSYNENELNHYELYKKHWGLNIYSGVQFGYKLGPNYLVYLEPNARIYPKSITLDNNPISQKVFIVGASLGIKYRL